MGLDRRRKMSRSRIINLIICIVVMILVSIITLLGCIFLNSKGLLFKDYIGLTMVNWLQIIVGVIILGFILYDFTSIRVKRKKYGKLRFRLKRKDTIKQTIALILLLIIYFIQAWIFTSGFKEFDLDKIFMMFCVAPLPLLFGYHNIEKEGLGDKAVYYWGYVIQWNKVCRYNFKGDTLRLTISKRSFGKDEEYEIPFIVNRNDKIVVEEFLCEKMRIKAL